MGCIMGLVTDNGYLPRLNYINGLGTWFLTTFYYRFAGATVKSTPRSKQGKVIFRLGWQDMCYIVYDVQSLEYIQIPAESRAEYGLKTCEN